ncbi:MAG TPA: hypothetical protein VFO16_08215 [Pseudonocardiaceae bacterium]|nr:hypothetical protein [Pseudonocardiaceae bacterium]
MRVAEVFTPFPAGRDWDRDHDWDRDRDRHEHERGRHHRGHYDRYHRWCWDD